MATTDNQSTTSRHKTTPDLALDEIGGPISNWMPAITQP